MNFNSPPVSVIYLNDAKERYNLNYDEAISRCVGINTQIATLQLLRDNYNLGWDTCTCCWVDLSGVGKVYNVVQKSGNGCAIGITKCNFLKNRRNGVVKAEACCRMP